MVDDDLKRAMELSDLPKLGPEWRNGDTYSTVTWKIYKKWLNSVKISVPQIDNANPMISAWTAMFMEPVVGTCSVAVWLIALAVYRRRVRVRRAAYNMNQYQKQAFVAKHLDREKLTP